MIQHHIEAAARVPGMIEIIILGFYDPALFDAFIETVVESFGVPIRYLRESKELGTAGGLNRYRDDILSGSPDAIFILHCDIGCTFPLADMLSFHRKHGRNGTVMAVKVSEDEAHKYGEMVLDPNTNELLHYAEKPAQQISSFINSGIYIFGQAMFDFIAKISNDANRRLRPAASVLEDGASLLRMEQDVLMPLTGKGEFAVYVSDGFWYQIKDPPAALVCSAMYMDYLKEHRPHLLARPSPSIRSQVNKVPSSGDFSVGLGSGRLNVVGTAIIHPTAKVHPTARIGPNVSIAAGVEIGPGARLRDCIILDDVIIRDHAVIIGSIVGWSSTIGLWTRVQGTMEKPTIFGAGVSAGNEVVIASCVVLPHKALDRSQRDQIIL